MNNDTAPIRDIMQYESKIWAIADMLLSAGIKQSKFPEYMMPFFALVMLEGRMLNVIKEIEEEEGITPQTDPEDFKEAFLEKGCGYNECIVMQGKTLLSICSNDSTFEHDLNIYLNAFDPNLQQLLGVNSIKDHEYLNIKSVIKELRSPEVNILMDVATAWAQIDLSGYDNSAITTLEEHIKRKWADMSADTAGMQYTPDDIISLITEIVVAKAPTPNQNRFLHIYDPTCGGANLLFGVEDRLKEYSGYENIATYGCELNTTLYALASIESLFRKNSTIKHGNTLTTVPFADKAFDIVVANPPYGTPWKNYSKEVKNDQRGQFPGGLPATNDGQLLFMQHILWQLAPTGIAVEVHNGSSLFSGDAGGGESNIRKYIFDHDWVEAIIQMPQQEFFNTGIYTYLWIMNKNKPQERKDKVALIDGSKGWAPLRKSKGDKRREMKPEHRQAIVDALLNFTESDICKIYDREYFYYNKQSIKLYETNDEGISICNSICQDGPVEIVPAKLRIGALEFSKFKGLNTDEVASLSAAWCANEGFELYGQDGLCYSCNSEDGSIMRANDDGVVENLGCGDIVLKIGSVSKKTGLANAKITIIPVTYNDYEVIPHHFDEEANTSETEAFLGEYIYKPFEYGKNVVGVEINLSKEFYMPEVLDSANSILKEIEGIDEQIKPISL